MVVVIPRLLRGSLGAICTQAALLRSTPSAFRYLTRSSVMKSKRRPDHLERTADVVRQEIFLHIQTTEGLIHQPEGVHGLGNKGSSPVTSVVSAAKVCGVASESPSVKRLCLLVADKDFSFKAGQWVDFFIPGVSVVGGFSICSSPRLLEQERMIELAVKHANHPPALWIHNQGDSLPAEPPGKPRKLEGRLKQSVRLLLLGVGSPHVNTRLQMQMVHSCRQDHPCVLHPWIRFSRTVNVLAVPPASRRWTRNSLGDGRVESVHGPTATCTLDSEVAVRVGGEFFFDPKPTDASRNLVLIAGGVGINPLLSILRHAADLLRERASKGQGYEMGTVRLLYSAKDTSELLFKKNILDLVNEFPEQIACSLHVTKQTTQITADLRPYITEGRITQKEIRDHISKETLFYICGPPPMTDFFSRELESSRVPREHICFEKWW